MRLGFSQQEIKGTLAELNLPEHSYYMRRAARALDIVNQDKVHFLGEDVFRVDSQYDDKHYHVEINHGNPGCTCEDFKKNGVSCKHMIAATIYSESPPGLRRRAGSLKSGLTIYDDTNNSYHGRGRWIVTDPKAKVKYIIYRDKDGRLHCPCNPRNRDCEHKKAIRDYTNNNGGGGNGTKPVNECGTENAKQLQDKMNNQLDSQKDNGNGAYCAPSQTLDVSDPFQESEQNDIDQIEGRRNGETAWKLSNGDYCISYKGVMELANKHHITFDETIHDDTHTVIAKARRNGSERVSGKPMNGNANTAMELAKRNAARQLLPLAEIKAVEKKYQLECEFSWEVAYQKCQELVGGKAQVDIIIHELVKDGKIRQDSPTHYNRTEWLIIHDACKKDAESNDVDNNDDDGGDNTPSPNNWQSKLRECKEAAYNWQRYDYLRSDLEREGILSGNPKDWQDSDFDILQRACELDTSLHNRVIGDFVVIKEWNWNDYDYSRRYRFWLVTKDTEQLREKCFWCGKTKSQVSQLSDELIYWERYYIKTVVCSDCFETMTKQDLTKRFNELYHNGNGAVNTDGLPKPSEDFINQINNVLNKQEGNATPSERTPELPLTEDDFVSKCKEAIAKVKDEKKSIEANDQPLQKDNGDKRKLMMDKKLKTWLVESDGTKKEMSCREICEQFESKQNPSIVTRLRAGINDGADISTVEID